MPRASRPTLSIVVISRDEGLELRRTVENLEDTLAGRGEIVVVDDGSRDRSSSFLRKRGSRIRLHRTEGLGVARARNWGAARARGEIVVFADAHIRAPQGWWKPLTEVLEDPAVGAAAPAVAGMRSDQPPGYGLVFRGPDLRTRWLDRLRNAPFSAPILPGCALAVRRDVFTSAGGWDEGLMGVGGNDNELCLRLWLLGHRLLVCPEVVIRHRFRKRSRVPGFRPEFLHNKLRLAFLHFKPERVAKVVGALQNEPALGAACGLLAAGDTLARRRDFFARRSKNDDWCFKRFGLEW